MKKRMKMSKKSSRKNFTRGSKIKGRNLMSSMPMRGGIRL